MFTATKIESTYRPQKFESLNNGVWYYNYSIEEKPLIEDEVRYSYILVRISGKPTVSKCFEAILKVYLNENSTSLYNVLLTDGSNELIEDIKYNVKVDFNIVLEKSLLDREKELVIRKIEQYDTSDKVNSFSFNGILVWLNKDTRVGLMNSINIEKNSGKTESTLWLNGLRITVNCEMAILMLSALELYALSCYNKTEEHKLIVSKLTSVSDVRNYDYTSGYPDKLVFTV